MPRKPFRNRKAFILSHGATCRNWTWSWSFVNEQDHKIIFGAWDINSQDGRTLLLSDAWEVEGGKRSLGYIQGLAHLRLIEEKGYQLYTFKIMHSDERQDEQGNGPAKIRDFDQTITRRWLTREGGKWYACDGPTVGMIPEEVTAPSELFLEGALKSIQVNAYERSAQARDACIQYHKAVCAACEFDFSRAYGAIAKGLIHVHHIVPLSEIRKEYQLNPITDLIPLCANCHAVVHRRTPALSIAELREHLAAAQSTLRLR